MSDDFRLASLVVLRPDLLDGTSTCQAWVESAERECGKPRVHGYLCKRHHDVAVRREKEAITKATVEAGKRAEKRALMLPEWKAELERVDAEIDRLDRPVVNDRAAVGGFTHPSIWKKQQAALSDSKVRRMGWLWRRHDELTRLIDGAL